MRPKSHVCTMWENVRLSYFLGGRGRKDDGFEVVFGGIVIALKDGERFMTRDSHDPFVVPAFTDLSGHKRMSQVVEMESIESSLTACGCP